MKYDEVTKELKVVQTTKLSEVMESINEATKKCQVCSNLLTPNTDISNKLPLFQDLKGSEFSSCIATGIMDDVTRITEAKTTMASYRDLMSARLRNYTCADDSLNSTEPVN